MIEFIIEHWWGILICLFYIGFGWYAISNINRSQNKIITGFEKVRKELLDADTREAFEEAWRHAIEWNKDCWHKSHGAMARELKGIIDTKKQIYGIK